MAPDSNIVRFPSVITGTLPVGLSARHSGLERNLGEKSMTSTS